MIYYIILQFTTIILQNHKFDGFRDKQLDEEDRFDPIDRLAQNLGKTKAELYDRAITHRILLAPCQTVKDIVESPQLADIEDRSPESVDHFHRVLQNVAFDESMPVNLRHVADATMDYRPRIEIAYTQYANFYQRHPEDYLTHNAKKLFSGKGSSGDHFRVQKLFHDSFQGYPELMHLYSRS